MFPIIGKRVFPFIDLDVVRMQFPAEQRRNYKNVFNAFTRISREEGITTLWRGSVATMGRAVVVNVSQLATYSQAKFLISTKCTYQLQILSISEECYIDRSIKHVLFHSEYTGGCWSAFLCVNVIWIPYYLQFYAI